MTMSPDAQGEASGYWSQTVLFGIEDGDSLPMVRHKAVTIIWCFFLILLTVGLSVLSFVSFPWPAAATSYCLAAHLTALLVASMGLLRCCKAKRPPPLPLLTAVHWVWLMVLDVVHAGQLPTQFVTLALPLFVGVGGGTNLSLGITCVLVLVKGATAAAVQWVCPASWPDACEQAFGPSLHSEPVGLLLHDLLVFAASLLTAVALVRVCTLVCAVVWGVWRG